MKFIRIVSSIILLSTMVLASQIGQIQAYYRSPDFKVANHIEDSNLSGITTRPSSSTTTYLPFLRNGTQTAIGTCHFGITVPNGLAGYDLSSLGIDSYLDWGHIRTSSVASNIQYYSVLNVSDSLYAGNLQVLPALLTANPGLTWIIGN